MNTVFTPPDPLAASSGDLMSTSPKSMNQLLGAGTAANADQVGEPAAVEAKLADTAGGWDAYEVWRRFIKEARARRQHSDPN